MVEVSNQGRFWRWITLGAAIALLDASLAFQNVWPTPAVRWHGELSIELAVCLLALAVVTRWVGAPKRTTFRALSAIWAILVISRYAAVMAPSLYGREVNLYWDLRHVSAVGAMLARVASWRLVLVVLATAILIPLLLYAAARWAFGRVDEAMRRIPERRALSLVAGAVVLLFVVQHFDERVAAAGWLPLPVTATYARQGWLFARGLTGLGRARLGPGPAMQSDLSRIHGADVLLVFVESYGAVAYDRPDFARALAPSRAQLEADVRETGREVVSAFVESPTFGGNSWLAHVSLLSGLEIRDEDANVLLMAEKRETLVSAFAREGYRTLAVMPGLQQSWPEGAFYGFDQVYDERRLDYRGPSFGWWTIPDQYALARADALEVSPSSRAPVFIFFPTTGTHTPFTPTAPYQSNWPRMLTDQPYDEADLSRAWDEGPDWMNLGPSYVRALSSAYASLGGYLRLRTDSDFVMILIGDHQPPAAVSGEGARWDVPVHVITRRQAVLDQLMMHGFRSGLQPAGSAVARMHALAPVFLEAFGHSTGSGQGHSTSSGSSTTSRHRDPACDGCDR